VELDAGLINFIGIAGGAGVDTARIDMRDEERSVVGGDALLDTIVGAGEGVSELVDAHTFEDGGKLSVPRDESVVEIVVREGVSGRDSLADKVCNADSFDEVVEGKGPMGTHRVREGTFGNGGFVGISSFVSTTVSLGSLDIAGHR